jgi:1,4-alpha-glucan branching enzyme
LYAPARCYGTPDQLRHLINAYYRVLGLAVLIDIVYNHLGPDGNYLECYSPHYFSARHTTPWGKAPNVDLKPVTEEERKGKDPDLPAKSSLYKVGTMLARNS